MTELDRDRALSLQFGVAQAHSDHRNGQESYDPLRCRAIADDRMQEMAIWADSNRATRHALRLAFIRGYRSEYQVMEMVRDSMPQCSG